MEPENDEIEINLENEPYIGGGGQPYTEGYGINIENNEISVDTNEIQEKLEAGENIVFDDNTISAKDTTYTAGNGIYIESDEISIDNSVVQEKLIAGDNIAIDDNVISAKDTLYTAGDNISISDENVISATDTTYNNFVGTDGQTAGSAGLVPAPATTDADKFLKSDGTWATAGGGGGGDTVYSNKTTSNSAAGGAVYIGNLNASQQEQPDPTTTDNHIRYFWALPFLNTNIPEDYSLNIMGTNAKYNSVVVGSNANNPIGTDAVAVGGGATVRAQDGVCIGHASYINNNITSSVALGSRSSPTRTGEVNIGNIIGAGYNGSNYRVLGGVYDGQLAQDAATVNQVNATIDAINTALNTNIPHIGA